MNVDLVNRDINSNNSVSEDSSIFDDGITSDDITSSDYSEITYSIQSDTHEPTNQLVHDWIQLYRSSTWPPHIKQNHRQTIYSHTDEIFPSEETTSHFCYYISDDDYEDSCSITHEVSDATELNHTDTDSADTDSADTDSADTDSADTSVSSCIISDDKLNSSSDIHINEQTMISNNNTIYPNKRIDDNDEKIYYPYFYHHPYNYQPNISMFCSYCSHFAETDPLHCIESFHTADSSHSIQPPPSPLKLSTTTSSFSRFPYVKDTTPIKVEDIRHYNSSSSSSLLSFNNNLIMSQINTHPSHIIDDSAIDCQCNPNKSVSPLLPTHPYVLLPTFSDTTDMIKKTPALFYAPPESARRAIKRRNSIRKAVMEWKRCKENVISQLSGYSSLSSSNSTLCNNLLKSHKLFLTSDDEHPSCCPNVFSSFPHTLLTSSCDPAIQMSHRHTDLTQQKGSDTRRHHPMTTLPTTLPTTTTTIPATTLPTPITHPSIQSSYLHHGQHFHTPPYIDILFYKKNRLINQSSPVLYSLTQTKNTLLYQHKKCPQALPIGLRIPDDTVRQMIYGLRLSLKAHLIYKYPVVCTNCFGIPYLKPQTYYWIISSCLLFLIVWLATMLQSFLCVHLLGDILVLLTLILTSMISSLGYFAIRRTSMFLLSWFAFIACLDLIFQMILIIISVFGEQQMVLFKTSQKLLIIVFYMSIVFNFCVLLLIIPISVYAYFLVRRDMKEIDTLISLEHLRETLDINPFVLWYFNLPIE